MPAATAILQKELRDAVRGRWLIAFSGTFAVVALLLALVQGGGDLGSQGFNRTTAGLINLSLLLVPLVALVLGAGAVAGERERGTLSALLSQPLGVAELLLGKYVGLTLTVWLAITLGFGGAGLLMALLGPLRDAGHYLVFVALAGLLAASMLSVGLLFSVMSRARTKALGLAIAAWFAFVLLYDLGAIGMILALAPSERTLLLAVLANPVQCVRILLVLSVEPDLTVLGPLGAYLVEDLGVGGALALLLGAVGTWVVAPLGAAIWALNRQDVA